MRRRTWPKRSDTGSGSVDTKQCVHCCVEKAITSFPLRKNSPDGRANTCRTCAVRQHREWRETGGPERVAENAMLRAAEIATRTKPCRLCKRILPWEDYYEYPQGRHGTKSECKECAHAVAKARGPAMSSKENRRKYRVKNYYGMTPETYQALIDRAGGRCELCHLPFVVYRTSPGICIDHDHTCCPGTRSCGKCVRGLLCVNCNLGLGKFRDNPDLLRLAAGYIEQSGPGVDR